MEPAYIKNILNVKMGRTGLQSGASTVLEVPKTKLVRCGDRAFCKTAPLLWNDFLTGELKITEKNSYKNLPLVFQSVIYLYFKNIIGK